MILIEQLALSNFKSYLTDTSWQVKNCCRWHGIRCSNTLHVVAADVRNPLVLWFHSHILVLIWAWNIKDSHTTSVRSTHTKNALEGNIPREIGLLRGLFMLKHSWNGLHGEIPNIIGNMSGLESLDLSFNNVSGQNIPASINLLDFFSVMNLSRNNLSGGFHQVCGLIHWMRMIQYTLGMNIYVVLLCNLNASSLNQEDAGFEDSRERLLLLYGMVFIGYVVGFWGFFGALYLIKEKWRGKY